MRIRRSWAAPLPLISVLLLPGILLIAVRDSDSTRSWEASAQFLAAFAVLATFLYLFGLWSPSAEVLEDRFRINGRGWSPWRVLGSGERFVLCRGRLHVQRVDGSLMATGIAKWSTAKRHWRRLERWFPTIDGT